MNKQQLASKIWAAANKMRSKIEANEYKDYILGFIFYKFLSDKEESFFAKDGMTKDDMKQYLFETDEDTVKHAQKNLGYFISYDHLFSTWVDPDNNDFSVAIVKDALSAFSRLINKGHEKVFKDIFKTYVDYSKTMLDNKIFVDLKMKELDHTYIYIYVTELVFTKNNEWSWQKEWRIAKENPNYRYDIAEYYLNGKIVGQNDDNINKCKFGFTVKAKPIAIYVRKHVNKNYVDIIGKYANENNIKVYYENIIGDKELFERI